MAVLDRTTAVKIFKIMRGADYEMQSAAMKQIADYVLFDDMEFPTLFSALVEHSGEIKYKPINNGESFIECGRKPTSLEWLAKPTSLAYLREALTVDLVKLIKL